MKEIHTPLGPCMALTVPVLSTAHITETDRHHLQPHLHPTDDECPLLSPWLRHILSELRKAGFEYVRFDPEATPTPGLPNLSDL